MPTKRTSPPYLQQAPRSPDKRDVGDTLNAVLQAECGARRQRIVVQKALIVVALASFLVSLGLPAVRISVEGQTHDYVAGGISCLLSSEKHSLSNLFFLAAPLVCWLLRKCRGRIPSLVFALLACASFTIVCATPFTPIPALLDAEKVTFLIGFYLWVVAHAVMTGALLVRVRDASGESAREAEALRARFSQLQEKWAPTRPAAGG